MVWLLVHTKIVVALRVILCGRFVVNLSEVIERCSSVAHDYGFEVKPVDVVTKLNSDPKYKLRQVVIHGKILEEVSKTGFLERLHVTDPHAKFLRVQVLALQSRNTLGIAPGTCILCVPSSSKVVPGEVISTKQPVTLRGGDIFRDAGHSVNALVFRQVRNGEQRSWQVHPQPITPCTLPPALVDVVEGSVESLEGVQFFSSGEGELKKVSPPEVSPVDSPRFSVVPFSASNVPFDFSGETSLFQEFLDGLYHDEDACDAASRVVLQSLVYSLEDFQDSFFMDDFLMHLVKDRQGCWDKYQSLVSALRQQPSLASSPSFWEEHGYGIAEVVLATLLTWAFIPIVSSYPHWTVQFHNNPLGTTAERLSCALFSPYVFALCFGLLVQQADRLALLLGSVFPQLVVFDEVPLVHRDLLVASRARRVPGFYSEDYFVRSCTFSAGFGYPWLPGSSDRVHLVCSVVAGTVRELGFTEVLCGEGVPGSTVEVLDASSLGLISQDERSVQLAFPTEVCAYAQGTGLAVQNDEGIALVADAAPFARCADVFTRKYYVPSIFSVSGGELPQCSLVPQGLRDRLPGAQTVTCQDNRIGECVAAGVQHPREEGTTAERIACVGTEDAHKVSSDSPLVTFRAEDGLQCVRAGQVVRFDASPAVCGSQCLYVRLGSGVLKQVPLWGVPSGSVLRAVDVVSSAVTVDYVDDAPGAVDISLSRIVAGDSSLVWVVCETGKRYRGESVVCLVPAVVSGASFAVNTGWVLSSWVSGSLEVISDFEDVSNCVDKDLVVVGIDSNFDVSSEIFCSWLNKVLYYCEYSGCKLVFVGDVDLNNPCSTLNSLISSIV